MDLCERGQMTPEEELTHWWIRTRFEYLERCLRRFTVPISVLEVGCGTAQNLRYLRERSTLSSKLTRLVGLEPGIEDDVSREPWMNPADAIYRSADGIPGSFDVLVAMDVIEHLEDDLESLKEWLGLLEPGGSVLISVPAFSWLWSRHDVVLGHKRRYTKSSLRRLVRAAGLEIESLTYAFGFLVPPAYLVRKLLPEKGDDEHATALRLPHPIANALLYGAGRLEALLGGNPFAGTSVVGYFHSPGAVP
jgi:SAM-dependent methyltransferase